MGEPLAVVENGDKVSCVIGSTIDLLISGEEMEKAGCIQAQEPKVKKGVAVLYAKMAEQAIRGQFGI